MKILVFTHDIVFTYAADSGGRCRKLWAQGLASQMSNFSNRLQEQNLDNHWPFFVIQGVRILLVSHKDKLCYLGVNWNPRNKKPKFDTDCKPVSVVCKCLCLSLKSFEEIELLPSI